MVPGWHDRPEVDDGLRRVWILFCEWLWWDEIAPSSAVLFVQSQFFDEAPTYQRMLVRLFLALARKHRDLNKSKEPPPPDGDAGAPANAAP